MNVKGYQNFEDFKINIQRRNGKDRNFKVKGSWGIYDSYKYIRKNGWYDIGRPVKEHEFYTIIRSINNILAKEIAKGNAVKLPSRMGTLELRKYELGAKMIDGKLVITYPINWDATLRLWYKDAEARNNKILIRREEPYVYYVKYCKHRAAYENKCFYQFALNNLIKLALKDNIKEGKVDTLW